MRTNGRLITLISYLLIWLAGHAAHAQSLPTREQLNIWYNSIVYVKNTPPDDIHVYSPNGSESENIQPIDLIVRNMEQLPESVDPILDSWFVSTPVFEVDDQHRETHLLGPSNSDPKSRFRLEVHDGSKASFQFLVHTPNHSVRLDELTSKKPNKLRRAIADGSKVRIVENDPHMGSGRSWNFACYKFTLGAYDTNSPGVDAELLEYPGGYCADGQKVERERKGSFWQKYQLSKNDFVYVLVLQGADDPWPGSDTPPDKKIFTAFSVTTPVQESCFDKGLIAVQKDTHIILNGDLKPQAIATCGVQIVSPELTGTARSDQQGPTDLLPEQGLRFAGRQGANVDISYESLDSDMSSEVVTILILKDPATSTSRSVGGPARVGPSHARFLVPKSPDYAVAELEQIVVKGNVELPLPASAPLAQFTDPAENSRSELWFLGEVYKERNKFGHWLLRLSPETVEQLGDLKNLELQFAIQGNQVICDPIQPFEVSPGPFTAPAIDVSCKKRPTALTILYSSKLKPELPRGAGSQVTLRNGPCHSSNGDLEEFMNASCIEGFTPHISVDLTMKLVENSEIEIPHRISSLAGEDNYSGVRRIEPKFTPAPRKLVINVDTAGVDPEKVASFITIGSGDDNKVGPVKSIGPVGFENGELNAEVTFNERLFDAWAKTKDFTIEMTGVDETVKVGFEADGDDKTLTNTQAVAFSLYETASDLKVAQKIAFLTTKTALSFNINALTFLPDTTDPNYFCELGLKIGDRDVHWLENDSTKYRLAPEDDDKSNWEFAPAQSVALFRRGLRKNDGVTSNELNTKALCGPEDQPAFRVTTVGEIGVLNEIKVPFAKPLLVYFLRSEETDYKYSNDWEDVYEGWVEALSDLSDTRLIELRRPGRNTSSKNLFSPYNKVETLKPLGSKFDSNLFNDVRNGVAKKPPSLKQIIQDAKRRGPAFGLPKGQDPDVLVMRGFAKRVESCRDLSLPPLENARLVILDDKDKQIKETGDERKYFRSFECDGAELGGTKGFEVTVVRTGYKFSKDFGVGAELFGQALAASKAALASPAIQN